VLGLSVESSRAHTAFSEQLDLPFPLLSDLNREVVREYGVMYTPDLRHREGYYGISKRAVFVLDQSGTVRYAWITDDALVTPNVDDIVAAVEQVAHPK
jgi:peroxiredoxin